MLFGHFLGNRDASVAPMLALAALPLFGFVGAAVDYSRAASVRSSMQAALDATALMLSKEAQSLSTGDLAQKANTTFNAIFDRPEANNVQITSLFASPQQSSFSLTVSASSSINTVFTKVLGHSEIKLSASSEVLWGIKKLNLALVLDNTGSMASSDKMTNLKLAAHNLLNTLQTAAKTPGDVSRSPSCRSPPTSMSAPAMSTRPGSIGPSGKLPTEPAATPPTRPRRNANRTARYGRPSRTASGTAASMTATRTTTS
jgi:Flp pilus assembly protein TadG